MCSPIIKIDFPRKKLLGIDSQRIFRVLDEFILQLDILLSLPPALQHIDRLSVDLGSDLRSFLILYREIIQSAGHGPISEDLEIRANEIIQSIIRSFAVNPTALANLKNKFYKQQSQTLVDLIKKFADFRTTLLDRLLLSRQEEINHVRSLKSIEIKQDTLHIELTSLDHQVRRAVLDSDEELGKNNIQLKYLKAEMETLHRIHLEDEEFVKHESKKLKEQNQNSHMQMNNTLLAKKTAITKELNVSIDKNRISEAALRERKDRIEQEVDNWIQRYDNEMGEKQDRIDDLCDKFLERCTDLELLDQNLFVLEKEFLAVLETRRHQREIREAKEKFLELQSNAIIKLQYYWRRYRKLHPKRPKSKKGKGKVRGKK